MLIFGVHMLCNIGGINQHFRGIYCLHTQGRRYWGQNRKLCHIKKSNCNIATSQTGINTLGLLLIGTHVQADWSYLRRQKITFKYNWCPTFQRHWLLILLSGGCKS